ncbi:MAG: hypothetical protein U0Z70_00260 [Thermomicrobiales bacterium]
MENTNDPNDIAVDWVVDLVLPAWYCPNVNSSLVHEYATFREVQEGIDGLSEPLLVDNALVSAP